MQQILGRAVPLKRIIVGSREDAKSFRCDNPYAVLSFVGDRYHKSPPRLTADPQRVARIVIRSDDTYPGIAGTVALSEAQADRIARFVRRMASKIDTLFIHCHFGHGRSCGAAIAVARALGLPWSEFLEGERVGNGHVTLFLARALERVGYNCGANAAAYDTLYLNHVSESTYAPRLP